MAGVERGIDRDQTQRQKKYAVHLCCCCCCRYSRCTPKLGFGSFCHTPLLGDAAAALTAVSMGQIEHESPCQSNTLCEDVTKEPYSPATVY